MKTGFSWRSLLFGRIVTRRSMIIRQENSTRGDRSFYLLCQGVSHELIRS